MADTTPDTAALTSAEVATLPEGEPVVIIWSGGNGPHRYLIAVNEHGTRHAVDERNRDNPQMRYYNPLTFVGQERFHTRVWRAEPDCTERECSICHRVQPVDLFGNPHAPDICEGCYRAVGVDIWEASDGSEYVPGIGIEDGGDDY